MLYTVHTKVPPSRAWRRPSPMCAHVAGPTEISKLLHLRKLSWFPSSLILLHICFSYSPCDKVHPRSLWLLIYQKCSWLCNLTPHCRNKRFILVMLQIPTHFSIPGLKVSLGPLQMFSLLTQQGPSLRGDGLSWWEDLLVFTFLCVGGWGFALAKQAPYYLCHTSIFLWLFWR
jgi:hypothetical protein